MFANTAICLFQLCTRRMGKFAMLEQHWSNIANCDPVAVREIQIINEEVRRSSHDSSKLKEYLRGQQLKWHPDKTSWPAEISGFVFRNVQNHWEANFKT